MPEKKSLSFPAFDQFIHALPGLYLVMTPDFRIVEMSDDFVHASLVPREQMVGKYIFDVFPEDQASPADQSGTEELRESLEYVLAHKKPHRMPVTRYDTVDRGHPGRSSKGAIGSRATFRSWMPKTMSATFYTRRGR